MIVVTGASGQLGGAVIEGLLRRLPADRVVASVRDPEKLRGLADRGVHVRAGDFAKPDSLATAFEGAEQVLVVAVNQLGESARRMHHAAIKAAYAAGARRVLYTSRIGVERADSPSASMPDYIAAEALLAETGRPFTSLRHGAYAESALFHIGRGIEDGEIRAPEDGPVSWVTRADLAEADAIVLAEEGRLNGFTPPLTAPEAFTMADLAAIASELTGREIKRITLTDKEWRDAKVAQGLPAPMADILLTTYRASRRGDFATVDPTLEKLLGRRPRTMRDVLAGILQPAPDSPRPG